MPEPKRECPLCGEWMRLVERQHVDRIAGVHETKARQMWEWQCPECDYFEEAAADGSVE